MLSRLFEKLVISRQDCNFFYKKRDGIIMALKIRVKYYMIRNKGLWDVNNVMRSLGQ